MTLLKPVWIAAILCQSLASGACAKDHAGDRDFPSGSGGFNAAWQVDKPYLFLVSIDGYRWDFPDLYPTPAIGRLIGEGVRAERLVPVWPTLTFPNHYTMATGLHPADHGLVSNDFPDPSSRRWYRLRDRSTVEDGYFYGGEPIWVTAETQGMVTAAYFWVGTEADVQGVRPTHWRRYDKRVLCEERVMRVLEWLAGPPETRPHLYTLYFEAVDDHAHWHGPGSDEFRTALAEVDACLGLLLRGIEKVPHHNRVNLLLVSDHGHMEYHDAAPFVLDRHIRLQGLRVTDGGAYVFAWQERPDADRAREIARRINAAWAHGSAYTAETAPAEWRLGENPRTPHIVFQADPGYAVLSTSAMQDRITASDHGWAPDTPEMHGIFIAWGPQVNPEQMTGKLVGTDVQRVMLDILDLQSPGS